MIHFFKIFPFFVFDIFCHTILVWDIFIVIFIAVQGIGPFCLKGTIAGRSQEAPPIAVAQTHFKKIQLIWYLVVKFILSATVYIYNRGAAPPA